MSAVVAQPSIDQASELCIVCGGRSGVVDLFPRERIVQSLEAITGKRVAAKLDVGDYRVLRCSACGLEFAEPMAEPGRDFYVWLTDAQVHYAEDRWEWQACADLVRDRAAGGRQSVVIDVGCGDGSFLRLIQQILGATGVGLDLNPTVVEACRLRGLDVVEGTLSSVRPFLPDGADVVTLWHVVEHVADPVGALTQARALLRTGGMICFSVPLTPMSYEHAWPDPLNAPPRTPTSFVALVRLIARRVGEAGGYVAATYFARRGAVRPSIAAEPGGAGCATVRRTKPPRESSALACVSRAAPMDVDRRRLASTPSAMHQRQDTTGCRSSLPSTLARSVPPC